MAVTVIEASQVVLEGGVVKEGPLYVTIEGERIVSIATTRPTSCTPIIKTHLLIPGFIDLHTHGLGGANDVIEFWSNPDYTLSRLPKVGTTSCLATIVLPKDHPSTPRLLDGLRRVVGVVSEGAVLEGVNSEGPVVNDYGGLPFSDQYISIDEFECLIDSIPNLKLMTISPHLEASNNYERIKALLKRGIRPSLGHDKVTTEGEILGALRLSKNPLHVTHLYNVCSFNHRQPGLVNIGLLSHFPDLPQYADLTPPTVEVIGDLAHVHPLSLSLLLQCKGYDKVCFITDSIYHSDTPGERIEYNGRHLIVSEDCKTLKLEGTDTIAGSCSSMLDVFYNLIKVLKVPLGQAVRMMTENPAKVANLPHTGSIAVGKRADLLLMDQDDTLTHTIVAGNIVWRNTNN